MIIEELLTVLDAELKHYRSGNGIFREEKLPFYFYQIKEEKIKLNNYTEDGKEFIQNLLSDGQSFGESLLFVDRPYPMNTVAMEDSVIFRMLNRIF